MCWLHQGCRGAEKIDGLEFRSWILPSLIRVCLTTLALAGWLFLDSFDLSTIRGGHLHVRCETAIRLPNISMIQVAHTTLDLWVPDSLSIDARN